MSDRAGYVIGGLIFLVLLWAFGSFLDSFSRGGRGPEFIMMILFFVFIGVLITGFVKGWDEKK